MTSLIRANLPRVPAVANWSRWICRCPVCPSAGLLDVLAPVHSCQSCGTDVEVVWPSVEMVYGIERLLLMRPDESTRNWEPGESLVDLMVENGAHGILDHAEGLLTVTEGSIRRDTLPLTWRRDLRAVAA